MDSAFLRRLQAVFPPDRLIIEAEKLAPYERDLTMPMADLGRQVGQMVGVPCITQTIAQPATCKVYDERPSMTPVEVPACGGGAPTCYTLAPDATACPDAQHLKLSVTRPALPPADTMVSVRCAL